MSRKHGWLVLAAALTLAVLPAWAGEKGKCSGSTQDCLNQMAAKYAERGWVGVELDKGDYGTMTVKRVIPDSPAAAAGFRASANWDTHCTLAWTRSRLQRSTEL